MIFVDRSRMPPPDVLSLPGSAGQQERMRAVDFYQDPQHQADGFDFKAYKAKEVVDALTKLFHGKCAYCESTIIATQPTDIEHFRPKAGYNVLEQGRVRLWKPGYYWLAADWNNLLPSCIDCNRERNQELPEGEAPKKRGKGNHFPLMDESGRATRPGDEMHEEPLLLNPCCDDPEEHLEFIGDGSRRDGLVRARVDAQGQESCKGQVSIDVYGLRRMGLVQTRRMWIRRFIRPQLERVRKAVDRLDQHPDDPDAEQTFRREMVLLKKFTRADQPYTGMARQIINLVIEQLKTR